MSIWLFFLIEILVYLFKRKPKTNKDESIDHVKWNQIKKLIVWTLIWPKDYFAKHLSYAIEKSGHVFTNRVSCSEKLEPDGPSRVHVLPLSFAGKTKWPLLTVFLALSLVSEVFTFLLEGVVLGFYIILQKY